MAGLAILMWLLLVRCVLHRRGRAVCNRPDCIRDWCGKRDGTRILAESVRTSAGALFYSDDFRFFRSWFGGDWYDKLLLRTLVTTVCVAVAAVPYVVLGFVRGARPCIT